MNTFDPYYDVLLHLPPQARRALLLKLCEGSDPLDVGITKAVKEICREYVKELNKRGLIPDYYAYALCYWASQQPRALLKKAAANHAKSDHSL